MHRGHKSNIYPSSSISLYRTNNPNGPSLFEVFLRRTSYMTLLKLLPERYALLKSFSPAAKIGLLSKLQVPRFDLQLGLLDGGMVEVLVEISLSSRSFQTCNLHFTSSFRSLTRSFCKSPPYPVFWYLMAPSRPKLANLYIIPFNSALALAVNSKLSPCSCKGMSLHNRSAKSAIFVRAFSFSSSGAAKDFLG